MATNGIQLSFRRLVRQRAFSIPATVMLAVGLATVLAVYGPLESIVLRPLPYPQPDRLVRIWLDVPGLGEGQLWGLSKASFPHLGAADSLDAVALYGFGAGMLEGSGDGYAQQVGTAYVSASFFDLLRAPVALGRPMAQAENLRPSASLTPAWISDRLWRTHFGAAADAVGQVIELSGQPVEIAGVLPAYGRSPEEVADASFRVDVWLPLDLGPSSGGFGSHVFRALGRLAPGADLASAEAELAAIIAGLPDAEPAVYSPELLSSTGMKPALTALREDIVGPARQLLWILFGAVALVLIMALTNTSNLVVAFADRSRHEADVRAALGATPMRAISALLLDVALISVLASTLAFFLARAAIDSSLALMGPEVLPRFAEIGLPLQALGLCLLISLLLTLPVAWLAASGRGLLGATLRATGAARTSRGLAAARRALVSAQICISVALLAGALLLLRTSGNLERVDLGFEVESVTHLEVILPAEAYPDVESTAAAYRRLAGAAGDLAVVESASIAAHIPLVGMDGCSAIYDAGGPPPSTETALCLPVFLVSPGYFDTLGISLQGRAMTWADQASRAPVAVASRALAARLWPGLGAAEVLDQAVMTGPDSPPYRIVGVADDIRADGVDQPVSEILYLPMVPAAGDGTWGPIHAFTLSVATQTPFAGGVATEVGGAIRALDSRAVVVETRTMRDLVDLSMAQTRLLTRLVGLACLSALVLGAFGIYAVLAYLIVSRRAELGVRMALGAGRREIYGLVIGEALRLAAWGVGLGLISVLLLGRWIQRWLFEVSAKDPMILSVVCLLALLAVAAAAFAPAYRAARLPLATILRQD